jgi:hypothetical protein
VSEDACLISLRRKLEESTETEDAGRKQTRKRFKDWAEDDVTHKE